MDRQDSMCLVLLNLSVVFNMLDHAVLLKCLQNRFKITGLVLKWIESYLSDRSQVVVLKNEEGEMATSKAVRLSRGVPQGSVLGTLLFTLLGDICKQHDQHFHLYADDIQLYALFNASSEESRGSCMIKINSCVAEISTCMSTHLLKLNGDKSESMFIVTCQQLSNISWKLNQVWSLMGQKLCTWVMYKTWNIKWTVSSRTMATSTRSAVLLSSTYKTS